MPTFHFPATVVAQRIQVYNPQLTRGGFRHALFDFDGTLSLIRAGWQEVMLAQCVEELQRTPTDETPAQLAEVCRQFITRLTGKQTVYQMLQLAAEVKQRGGQPRPELTYKREYLERLHARIGYRIDALRAGRDPASRYLVAGSLELLAGLAARGVVCYLASGTDEEYVHDEARLLGVADYFAGGMYGARDDYLSFSKKQLMERIVAENNLAGAELVAFGDGYVEIENAKQVGGAAVGVASCEEGAALWDDWKGQRLLDVGADIVVPDWAEAGPLLAYLFAEAP
jgi:phosphoglycolate phosphatase-like HAD superfamily hydrolase